MRCIQLMHIMNDILIKLVQTNIEELGQDVEDNNNMQNMTLKTTLSVVNRSRTNSCSYSSCEYFGIILIVLVGI